MAVAAQKNVENPQETAVFALGDDAAYSGWRAGRLNHYPVSWDESIVTLGDIACPTDAEVSQIVNQCARTNFALYQSDMPILPASLSAFCNRLGLRTAESHRSASAGGVVAIERSTTGTKRGYIPYSDKPLSWHTDGYYNTPQEPVNAMVLHCVRAAEQGGENHLFDPAIAYIRLRDENPDFIKAFMHPEAMTVPANDDPKTGHRPASVGPVFRIDPASGQLAMRYSARARNIVWRDDETTREACDFLTHVLKSDPFVVKVRLQSGQGVISNNVLHNRTGFTPSEQQGTDRLLYRIRYRERVAGS